MNIPQKASQDLHLQGLIVGIPVRLALLEFNSYIQLFKQKAQSWDASSILGFILKQDLCRLDPPYLMYCICKFTKVQL